jgi:uncharacterized membrane protein
MVSKVFFSILRLLILAFFSYLMLKITLQYLPIQTDVAFLRIKQQYLSILPWKLAFFVHVFTSMFALIAGFTQFSPLILKKYPLVHRWIGKIYVFNILFLTGISGLIMSFFANGGITSRVAFSLLSILWIYFTFKAYQAIRHKQIQQHQAFMIRSYALTLSAITLRAWKWIIVLLFAPPPMDVYRIVAWLGFIPNLLVAEWLIRRKWKNKGQ